MLRVNCIIWLIWHYNHSGVSMLVADYDDDDEWEMTLHCNVIFHWLSPYPEWSWTYSSQQDSSISTVNWRYYRLALSLQHGLFEVSLAFNYFVETSVDQMICKRQARSRSNWWVNSMNLLMHLSVSELGHHWFRYMFGSPCLPRGKGFNYMHHLTAEK